MQYSCVLFRRVNLISRPKLGVDEAKWCVPMLLPRSSFGNQYDSASAVHSDYLPTAEGRAMNYMQPPRFHSVRDIENTFTTIVADAPLVRSILINEIEENATGFQNAKHL